VDQPPNAIRMFVRVLTMATAMAMPVVVVVVVVRPWVTHCAPQAIAKNLHAYADNRPINSVPLRGVYTFRVICHAWRFFGNRRSTGIEPQN
jgi:hypothetical protein